MGVVREGTKNPSDPPRILAFLWDFLIPRFSPGSRGLGSEHPKRFLRKAPKRIGAIRDGWRVRHRPWLISADSSRISRFLVLCHPYGGITVTLTLLSSFDLTEYIWAFLRAFPEGVLGTKCCKLVALIAFSHFCIRFGYRFLSRNLLHIGGRKVVAKFVAECVAKFGKVVCRRDVTKLLQSVSQVCRKVCTSLCHFVATTP